MIDLAYSYYILFSKSKFKFRSGAVGEIRTHEDLSLRFTRPVQSTTMRQRHKTKNSPYKTLTSVLYGKCWFLFYSLVQPLESVVLDVSASTYLIHFLSLKPAQPRILRRERVGYDPTSSYEVWKCILFCSESTRLSSYRIEETILFYLQLYYILNFLFCLPNL